MGLPLFVAPVESDLPQKTADKNNATSPSRSGVRRYSRQNSRERRAAMRRQMTIRDRLIANNSNFLQRQANAVSSREGRLLPWVEAGFPSTNEPSTDSLRRPRPFREVLREMTRGDDERRERLEEQMNTWFGTGWQDDEVASGPGEGERQDTDGESRPRYPLLVPSRHRTSPLVLQLGEHRPANTDAPPRHSHEPQPSFREGNSESNDRERRRNYVLHRIRPFDGLGDRDRSLSPDGYLSPEGWGTLLTTLTPDPQPPSTGSSFASNVASQSAGASSHTSLTTSGPVGPDVCDSGCESGCEGPDSDDDAPPPRRLRRVSPPRRQLNQRRTGTEARRESALQRAADAEHRGFQFEVVGGETFRPGQIRRRLPNQAPLDHFVLGVRDPPIDRTPLDPETAPPFARFHGLRNGWIGQLSVGSSEDEHGVQRHRRTREGSSTSGNTTSVNEDDWPGMQRIVRRLASREDIPDEWWAEAGLSRNLHHDNTDL